MKLDPAVDDYLVTQEVMAGLLKIGDRHVRRLRDKKLLPEKDGKLLAAASIEAYYAQQYGKTVEVDGLDESQLDLKIKGEDFRRKQRENDIAKGEVVKKADLIPFLRHYSKHTGRELDSIEGQLDGSLIECPDCEKRMRLDGRGRERVRETIIRTKNVLDDLHNNMESAKSSK